jgi:hypothetical protein
LSRTGRVRCEKDMVSEQESGRKGRKEHLSAPEVRVRRHVEDILNETVDSVPTNPEEDVLSVFDEEKTVTLETFRGEGERVRENDALVRDGTALQQEER